MGEGGWNWVHTARRPVNGLFYLPRVIVMMDNFGGMKIGRGNKSTRRKPAPASLCPPQIQGRRSGKPATNRLNYGAAIMTGLS
jgi:hypothetical protein